MCTSLQHIFKVPYILQCLLNYLFIHPFLGTTKKHREKSENKQLRNKTNGQNVKKSNDRCYINKQNHDFYKYYLNLVFINIAIKSLAL